jgi:hypothetical protein
MVFVTLRIAFGIKKIFSDINTIFLNAKTAVGSPEPICTAIETIVFIAGTTVFGTKTLFSEAKTIFFATENVFSITEKIVGAAPAMFI